MKFFQILLVLVSPLLVSSSDFNNNQSNHLSGNEIESLDHRETSEFGPEIALLCNRFISPDHNMTTNEFLEEMLEYLNTEIEEECDYEYGSDEEFETTIVPLSEDRTLSSVPIATPSGGQNSNLGQHVEEYENREPSEFDIEFARLCLQMISPDYNDTKLTDEFLVKMVEFVNIDIEDEADPQLRASDYIKILSLIAIKRGYPILFKQLQSLLFRTNGFFIDELFPNEYFQDEELKRVVKDHPKFFSSLPLDTFKIFLGSYNPSDL